MKSMNLFVFFCFLLSGCNLGGEEAEGGAGSGAGVGTENGNTTYQVDVNGAGAGTVDASTTKEEEEVVVVVVVPLLEREPKREEVPKLEVGTELTFSVGYTDREDGKLDFRVYCEEDYRSCHPLTEEAKAGEFLIMVDTPWHRYLCQGSLDKVEELKKMAPEIRRDLRRSCKVLEVAKRE